MAKTSLPTKQVVRTAVHGAKIEKNVHGANREAGVAGCRDEKFPARYELVSTIGLRCVAVAYGEVAEGYYSTSLRGGALNVALHHINEHRAGKNDVDHVAHACRALFEVMYAEEHPDRLSDEVGQSARRDGEAQPRFDLVPPPALKRLSQAYGEGSIKYTDNNWLNGFSEKVLLNHTMAHLNMKLTGDVSEDHLGHAAWNLITLMHFRKTRPDLLDLSQDLPDGQHR